jgi:hypothetical protein
VSWADLNMRTYTVQVTRDEAERWEAAATAHGHWSVGAWLRQIAEDFLRDLAITGRPRPLTWRRDRFRVELDDPLQQPPVAWEEEVSGQVSGSFAIFRGTSRGPGLPACGQWSLVHRPTGRILGTLRRLTACKAFAARLSALEIDWSGTDPERVVEGAPDQRKAQDLLRLYERLERR